MTFNSDRTDVYVYALLDPRIPRDDIFLPELKFQPFYIGMGVNKRIYTHRKGVSLDKSYKGLKINRIKAILKEHQEPISIKIAIGLKRSKAAELECELIAEFGTIAPIEGIKRGILTNMTAGGDGGAGHIVTSEVRELIRKAHLGKPKSDEHREKLRIAALISSPISNARQEVQEKIRKVHLGKPKTNGSKISEWRKANPISLEQREALSSKFKGKPRSPEMQQKLREIACKSGKLPWINKDGIVKRVADIEAYLADGWSRGRKPKQG